VNSIGAPPPEVGEVELIRRRYKRYLIVALTLIALALALTYTAMRIKSLWLMIISLSVLLAGFGLLMSGLVLRTEHKVMEEGGWRRPQALYTAPMLLPYTY